MVTRGRTYSSAPDAGSQQSVVVGTGPTPVSPIRRPSPTHRSQVTRNRRVVSSQRNVTRSPALIADFTFSISAPSRLRLVTRTRSRKARFFASMPQRLAVRIIGWRGWRRHPIDFTNPLVGLMRALRRGGMVLLTGRPPPGYPSNQGRTVLVTIHTPSEHARCHLTSAGNQGLVPREFGEGATWCRSGKNGGQWNLGSYPSTLLESSGNQGGIAWLWYRCSLEHDEGIVRIFGHTAGRKIEIPA